MIKSTLLLLLLFAGCNLDPRVVQCQKCKEVNGIVGGLLLMQGTICPCGGTIVVKRKLTSKEWEECKKKGFVTLNDGKPYDN